MKTYTLWKLESVATMSHFGTIRQLITNPFGRVIYIKGDDGYSKPPTRMHMRDFGNIKSMVMMQELTPEDLILELL